MGRLLAASSLAAAILVLPSRAEMRLAAPPYPPTVVLISLDGTRPADVTEALLPSLVALGREGARAGALVPVDPSNTFPNHVSLATGVRPDVHRIVNNSFIDPERGRFSRDEPNVWVESEPIWSIAERHGLPTTSFYWVGSEGPWSGGPGPRETRQFSSRTSEKTKVDQILKWLSTPDPTIRPRLITCWFHGADHAAHSSGPGTTAVAKALASQDTQIARLVREMETRGLFESTTLIFVSDHGMATVAARVNLGSRFRKAGLKLSLLGVGGFASAYFDEGKGTPEAVARAVEIARDAGLAAWPRSEAPADWHVDDVRFGDVVVRAPVGTAIVGSTTVFDGSHGYDAREPSMAGVLFARGRGVQAGTTIESVSNLAVAPTILRLLDLPVPIQMKEEPIAELLSGVEPLHAGAGATP
jgi:predicted AlkP superfamily pyrophosphatase or phosphodiesterase